MKLHFEHKLIEIMWVTELAAQSREWSEVVPPAYIRTREVE